MDTQSLNATRRDVLTALKRRGEMTVDEVAEHLGASGMTARYHLSALRAAGLVQSEPRRRGVGRPVEVYSLTPAADDLFPKAYDTLAVDILDQVKEIGGEEGIRAIFARGEEKLYAAYAPRMEGKALEEKIAEVARILDEIGYLATWTREGDAFYLAEHNCAVANVARRYSHPCDYEMRLIEHLLEGAEIERVEHQIAGQRRCAYRIRERDEDGRDTEGA